MKLRLITNEGTSNEFDIYLEPTRELIGRYQFNPGDELEFSVSEDGGLKAIAVDSAEYHFESGSI